MLNIFKVKLTRKPALSLLYTAALPGKLLEWLEATSMYWAELSHNTIVAGLSGLVWSIKDREKKAIFKKFHTSICIYIDVKQ